MPAIRYPAQDTAAMADPADAARLLVFRALVAALPVDMHVFWSVSISDHRHKQYPSRPPICRLSPLVLAAGSGGLVLDVISGQVDPSATHLPAHGVYVRDPLSDSRNGAYSLKLLVATLLGRAPAARPPVEGRVILPDTHRGSGEVWSSVAQHSVWWADDMPYLAPLVIDEMFRMRGDGAGPGLLSDDDIALFRASVEG